MYYVLVFIGMCSCIHCKQFRVSLNNKVKFLSNEAQRRLSVVAYSWPGDVDVAQHSRSYDIYIYKVSRIEYWKAWHSEGISRWHFVVLDRVLLSYRWLGNERCQQEKLIYTYIQIHIVFCTASSFLKEWGLIQSHSWGKMWCKLKYPPPPSWIQVYSYPSLKKVEFRFNLEFKFTLSPKKLN